VVTGVGAVTPLGETVPETWKRLIGGESGIKAFPNLPKDIPARVAAQVPQLTPNKLAPGSEPRTIQFAIRAAEEALQQAGKQAPLGTSVGVSIGSAMGSPIDLIEAQETLQSKGYRRVTPQWLPRSLPNMSSGIVAQKLGAMGPNLSPATACTAGAHAIIDAVRCIQMGDVPSMLAGGSESALLPVTFAGFSRARALSTHFNHSPQEASRPFSADREGFVLGEGSGVLFLERLEDAVSRGAKVLAEVKGYGLTGDAFHSTAPPPDGDGAFRAMSAALKRAELKPCDVGYVNAHATGTIVGDAAENNALIKLFEDSLSSVAISSTKGAIGHLLGAAGSVEAIFAILALNSGVMPPTLNLKNIDPAFSLNYIPLNAQKKELKATITNSFGFGGTNASIVFSAVNQHHG